MVEFPGSNTMVDLLKFSRVGVVITNSKLDAVLVVGPGHLLVALLGHRIPSCIKLPMLHIKLQ